MGTVLSSVVKKGNANPGPPGKNSTSDKHRTRGEKKLRVLEEVKWVTLNL